MHCLTRLLVHTVSERYTQIVLRTWTFGAIKFVFSSLWSSFIYICSRTFTQFRLTQHHILIELCIDLKYADLSKPFCSTQSGQIYSLTGWPNLVSQEVKDLKSIFVSNTLGAFGLPWRSPWSSVRPPGPCTPVISPPVLVHSGVLQYAMCFTYLDRLSAECFPSLFVQQLEMFGICFV